MMNLLYAVILGVIQGATEFLPISSSGHLVLAEYFLGVEKASLTFDVALHLGTLMAVGTYFWPDFRDMATGIIMWRDGSPEARWQRALFFYLCVGTIPGALAGAVFEKTVTSYFRAPYVVAFLLAAAGVALLLSDKLGSKKRPFTSLSLRDAVLIGLSQALALMPGVSRSGITMTAGLSLGLERQAVARFSFLLSAPIILGAAIFHVPAFLKAGMDSSQLTFFLSGILAAGVSGYIFIAFLMKYITTKTFAIFAYYRFILAGLVVIALLAR